jgi:hypothetical protein
MVVSNILSMLTFDSRVTTVIPIEPYPHFVMDNLSIKITLIISLFVILKHVL